MEQLLSRTWCDSFEDETEEEPLEAADGAAEVETWLPAPGPDALSKPRPRRWAITFSVIAVLLVAFSLIAFWGLTHSDWLYGTYGQITPAQWDRIADLRDGLVQLGVAPGAVSVLDDALLLPRPSTEEVLFDLRNAALALDRFASDAAVRRIQDQLLALSAEIGPGYQWLATPRPTPTLQLLPTPTPAPFMDAPVAHDDDRPPHPRALHSA